MVFTIRLNWIAAVLIATVSPAIGAQIPGQTPPEQQRKIEELERKVEVLAAEVEKLRSDEPQVEVSADRAKAFGLGPSAASVYRKAQGVSLAGYGEMLLENFAGTNETGAQIRKGTQLDFLRAIIYAGYRFNDKFLFNSEIEFEHANEVSVEFAYVDYLAAPQFALRGGMVLIPMGLSNEFHEPNVFLGARRSETESRIIPSTWRENGFGVVGSARRLNYRAYVVNGMNAAGFSADGLRGGRQKGARARASDFAFVGRLDLAPTPGLFFGGSFYTGGSGQDQFSAGASDLKVQTNIGEAHGQAQMRGLDLRALYARAVLGDVAALNRARSLSGRQSVGGVLHGGYLQLGYNLLAQTRESATLTPFLRYERINTQAQVPAGFVVDPARDQTFRTLGAEFKPIPNIVVKADYQWIGNRAKTGLSQFNIGLGYSF